ncbi:hypothetical protein Trco_006221 [Trichoderma cornu-damae]|uniref:Uncharacterized protein n=1 Tax=Trichoderma cornu-damae TaxID=654480 RepID=A0A9P8QGP6_9HYPO|nr:hypothetical protein Trco_006221 [Trichoderma cornu-damae]
MAILNFKPVFITDSSIFRKPKTTPCNVRNLKAAKSVQNGQNIGLCEGRYSDRRCEEQAFAAHIHIADEIERRDGPRGLHATSVCLGGVEANLEQYS